MVFELNDNNLLLDVAYKNCNYRILNCLGRGVCFVFCSSNGLYFPNELDVFLEKIVCFDRYEWTHVSTELLEYVRKIILIRDVRKNFYVTGINDKLNSIDQLIEFLKDECKGYRIITVGSSSGGYLASIVGAKLHAQAVFNFSGQWNLYKHNNVIKSYYYLNKYADSEMHNKYFSIGQMVKESGIPVFYFYPQQSEQDIKQAAFVRNIDNIYSLALNSDNHGQGLTAAESYVKLFLSDIEEIKKLSSSYSGKLLELDKISDLIDKLPLCKEVFNDRHETGEEIDIRIDSQRLQDKHLALFLMMNQWVRIKQDGKNFASYFVKKGYNRIAVYGMSYAGKTLINELKDTNIRVAYGIDRKAGFIHEDIPTITVEDTLEEVDAIVVTAITFFDKIKDRLSKKISCPIVSLKDILDEI